MALPPTNPDKTAAGIVVDPSTLERVVPTSRRKDGSVRKELKIRPGFTPQEDVGRFRGSRQRAQDQGQSMIPGSNRPRPPPATAENPFASPSPASGSKTKSQVKNEKRREKKRETTSTKAWDASDDESDGDIRDALNGSASAGDAGTPGATADERERAKQADGNAWPVDDAGQGQISEATPDGGGPPDEPIPIEPAVADRQDGDAGETAILSPPPPGPAKDDPAAPTAKPPKSAEPEWRTASSKRPSKPHPIQGGRQGPIGLAHPPPIESESRPRRQNPPRQRSDNKPPAQRTEGKQDKEPRVRKEYKVRDSGMGSLADRVKNLVISNQDSEQKKRDKPADKRADA